MQLFVALVCCISRAFATTTTAVDTASTTAGADAIIDESPRTSERQSIFPADVDLTLLGGILVAIAFCLLFAIVVLLVLLRSECRSAKEGAEPQLKKVVDSASNPVSPTDAISSTSTIDIAINANAAAAGNRTLSTMDTHHLSLDMFQAGEHDVNASREPSRTHSMVESEASFIVNEVDLDEFVSTAHIRQLSEETLNSAINEQIYQHDMDVDRIYL
jgi:hypothetical protein